VLKLRKNSIVDLPSALIFASIFLLMVFKVLPVAILVAIAGLFGIAISLLRSHAAPKGDAK
jgi:hypothetical protein